MTEEQREELRGIIEECWRAPDKADQPLDGVTLVDQDFLPDIAGRLETLLADDTKEQDIAEIRKKNARQS